MGMENEITGVAKNHSEVGKYIVTRIGRGVKLHLSKDINTGRLYPACGGDSPHSTARPTGHKISSITCAKCLEHAKWIWGSTLPECA